MKQLATLNKYFFKYRYRFLLGILFIVLTNYFRILAPQLTGYVVNSVVTQLDASHAAKGASSSSKYFGLVRMMIQTIESLPYNIILICGITLLFLALLSGFFMFLMRQTIIVMSRHIEFDQKNEIFRHYQELDLQFYKTHSTGDLMNRISEDVSRVRMYTGPAIMYFINLAAVIGFSLFFMLKASPKLTLVALAPLPLLAITIYFVNNIINKKSERVQSLLGNLTTNAQESYSGIRVIKSFVQERSMMGFFSANSELYRKNALGLARTEAIYFPSMALLIGVSTLLTIMVGAMDVVNHKGDVGIIAEFVLYIQMLTFPVSAIGWTASMTQRAATSQRRINEFLLRKPAIHFDDSTIMAELQGNIRCQGLDFIYPHTGIHAIRDFSLEIKSGQKIAIVGRTGSGKTTLAQLLLRLYDPQKGTILFDEIPIDRINPGSLRTQISYVPQDVFLFSDSVFNNISFSENELSTERVELAAKKAGIHEEIMQFKDGYQTLIGERGVTLSGGQKQRISLARALVKNPGILILDDCLSAVDTRTEQRITENLNQYMSGKTAIIITHRIFSLFHFDKIIVLEEGRVAEEGNHESLLAKNGLYSEMYRLQQEEDKVEVS